MSIPAKKLVSVIPGVVGVSGAALALSGLILTSNTAVPIGSVMQFSTAAAVSSFFGPISTESSLAAVYFAGYDNSTAKPGNLLFWQYPTAPVSGYMRGGSVAAMTLAQLQAVAAGTMNITVDGTPKTSASINLATATSFSDAAAKITAAFTGGPTFTYDAQRGAFLATSGTTGVSSAVSFASGTVATALNLTQATGAVTSAGAIASTPAAAMNAIVAVARNWAGFMTTFEPVIADKIAFATWAHQQGARFAYACWDTDVNATVQGNTTCFGYQADVALALDGSIPLTADANVAAALGVTVASLVQPLAAFVLGYLASLDFGRTNGRTTLAYRSQGALVAGVQDATVADTLIANGYNFYGNYATSQQMYTFMQPGQITGRFAYADSFANEVWMNANFQQTLMSFMASAGNIPYNQVGYSAIETILQGPTNQALNFGAIRAGVTLSGSQIVSVNATAGQTIDSVLSARGWYLSIKDPGATARAQRGSPQITLFYCDGGSIQQMTMASLLVQ